MVRTMMDSDKPWYHMAVIVWKGLTDDPLCRVFHADNKEDVMDEAKYWAEAHLTCRWFITYLGIEPR